MNADLSCFIATGAAMQNAASDPKSYKDWSDDYERKRLIYELRELVIADGHTFWWLLGCLVLVVLRTALLWPLSP